MNVTNLQATVNPDKSITLTWEDNNCASDIVEAPTLWTPNGQYARIANVEPCVLTHTFPPVPKNGKYLAKITSWVGDPEGPPASTDSETISIHVNGPIG